MLDIFTPYFVLKNSAKGPKARAGKKLKAPTEITAKIKIKIKVPSLVDSVPALTARRFLPARL